MALNWKYLKMYLKSQVASDMALNWNLKMSKSGNNSDPLQVSVIGKRGPLPRIYHSAEALLGQSRRIVRHGEHGAFGNEDFANLNMDNMASRNSGLSH